MHYRQAHLSHFNWCPSSMIKLQWILQVYGEVILIKLRYFVNLATQRSKALDTATPRWFRSEDYVFTV